MPKLLSVSPEKDKIVAVSVPFNVTDDKYRYVHFNLNEGLRKTEGMAVSEDVYNQMIENTNLSEMISAGKITAENFVLKPVAAGNEIIPVSVPVLIQEYQVRFNHVDINKGIYKQNGLLVKDAQFERMGSQPLDLIGGGHIEVNDEVFTVEEAGKVTATDLNDDMFVDLKIIDEAQTIIIVATKMENDTFKLTCKLGDHEFVSETNVEEDFEGEVTFVSGRYSFHVSLDCSSDSLTDEEEIALGALILNEVEDPDNPENPENPDNPENPKSLLFVPFTSSSEPTLFGKYSEDFIKMCALDLEPLVSHDSDLLLEGQSDVAGLPEGSHRLLTVISKVGDSYNAELHSITAWEDMTYNGLWGEANGNDRNSNIKKIAEGVGVLNPDNTTYSFSLMPLSAKELLQEAAHVATVPVEAVELIDAAGTYVEYNGVVQTGELAFSTMLSSAAEIALSSLSLSLFAPIYAALQPDLEYKLSYTKVNDILTLGLPEEAPLFENDEPPVEGIYCLKGQVSGTPDVYIRLPQEPSDDFEVPFAAYYTKEVSNPASEDPRAWISEFDSDIAGALLSAVVDSELLPESFEDYYSIKMELPKGAEQLSLIIEGQNEEIKFTSETYTADGDIRTFSFGDSELQGLPLEFTIEVDKEVASDA
ncbi:hypothetical protein EOM57_04955, partial [Candidatus Saccharibacteria bacterium]|nr:hypothetical protein [Candidatus Saccharibacteria bacterium]